MIRRQPEGNAPELAIGTYTEPFEVLRSGVGTYCENGDWTLVNDRWVRTTQEGEHIVSTVRQR